MAAFDDAITALYQTPLARFIAERKRLAGELRAAGHKTFAANIANRPRPPVSVWAVNQLYWHARDAFDAMLETAAKIRAGALSTSAAHREAIAALRQRATAMLTDAGHAATSSTLHRITTTLAAIAATGGFDPDPPGALTADRDPPGSSGDGLRVALVIRDASSGDRPAIDELSRVAFEELRRIYRPSEAALSGKSALDAVLPRIIAVGERDEIVGTVQYAIESPRLHLIGLAVHPAHRKIGVARLLVAHLAALACSRRLDVVSLHAVKETGTPAFFERLGFRSISERTDGWLVGVEGQPVTEVYMERSSHHVGDDQSSSLP